MDILEDLLKTKDFDKKKVTKFAKAGLMVGFFVLILIIALAIMFANVIWDGLNSIFNFSVLTGWLKNTINSFVPGFVK